ncbi:MAG: hypothetical protein IJX80_01795 [Clostridia bacterium]|nr:hypothetical protein [Clostridia bacterium]
MKHSFDEKLSYLFDEIGGVDERMLTEAMEYRSAKRSAKVLRTLTAIACALLVTVTGVSVILTNWRGWFVVDGTDSGPSDGAFPSWSTHTLDALLQNARGEASYMLLSSTSDVTYFGEAYLLWQYEDDGAVYQSRALTGEELGRLCTLIADGKAVGDTSPAQFTRVWLTLGNGDVLTPYLPTTPGNISATVFDYEAELIPSDELISCISDILKP